MAGNKQRPGTGFGIKRSNTNSSVVEKNNLGFIGIGTFSKSQSTAFSSFLDENKDFLKDFSPLGAVFCLSKNESTYLVRPVGIFRDSTEQIFLARESRISRSDYSSVDRIFNEIRKHNLENGYLQEIIGYGDISSDKVVNNQDLKILIRRSFVSVTGREVIASENAFKLSRAILALKNFLKYLDMIHQSGGYHGAVKLSNISFAIESEGLPLDYMIHQSSDIIKAQKNDLSYFSSILNRVLEELKTSEQDNNQKSDLIKALSPLLTMLKDAKYKNIPSTTIALDLFNEISSQVINFEERKSSKINLEEFRNITLTNEDKEESIEKIPVFVDEIQSQLMDSDFDEKKELPHVIKKSYLKAGMILGLLVTSSFLIYKICEKYSANISLSSVASSILDNPLMTTEELQLAWSSNVPSRMKLVAKQAIYSSPARGLAEEVILASVINSTKNNTSFVDSSLLRIAFSKEWEEQLNVDDRRYALAFSLRELVQEELPSDLGLVQERHPGVIAAIISSSVGKAGEVLSSISANVLETLPDPFGVAYKILLSGNDTANCSSTEVREFTMLSNKGIEDPKILGDFLSSDFSRRLAALSVIYSKNEEVSAKILDTIVNHPNLSIVTEETTWAKKVTLTQWQDVSYSDKLFLVSGVPLKGDRNLSPEIVARLFLNPASRVRSYAAGLAINIIKFKHPAAIEILELVQKDPDILTTNQLVVLGQILEDPEKTTNTHLNIIQSFIASKPPVEIIKTLLISSGDNREPSILDSILTVYLTEIGWSPNAADLMKLSLHKDKVARMFAYQKIFEFNDKDASTLMLKDAISKEKDPELKKQLLTMISKMS